MLNENCEKVRNFHEKLKQDLENISSELEVEHKRDSKIRQRWVCAFDLYIYIYNYVMYITNNIPTLYVFDVGRFGDKWLLPSSEEVSVRFHDSLKAGKDYLKVELQKFDELTTYLELNGSVLFSHLYHLYLSLSLSLSLSLILLLVVWIVCVNSPSSPSNPSNP